MEHERSIIPAIVTRCIQEVELRGTYSLITIMSYLSNFE